MPSITEQLLFLKQLSIFRDLTFEELGHLARYLETKDFSSGDILYHEGDIGRHLYILVRGRVRVVKDYGAPTERELACFHAGEFFGEMGIFEDKPHAATLIACEDVSVFVLAADVFKRLIIEHPSIAFAMGRELSARIRGSRMSDEGRQA
jgi:CRP/FNR family cyclic AMP-dependent transcriptional regulator